MTTSTKRGGTTRERRYTLLAAFFVLAAVHARGEEPATLTVSKIKDLNLRVYGFVETDAIADTTQGFTEEEDNNLVPKRTSGGADNFAGQHHRTEMSIRNSRLGFDLTVPKTDFGLQTEGVLELDLMGNNAPNTLPGASPSTQSERDFFNNPAVRVRHAYLNMTYGDWNAKIGQYWSLLGWQPYYFPGETIVQPGPAQFYRRFAQFRVMNTRPLSGGAWTLESAADAAKPAEMNSGNPELHAGLRLASTKYKGASVAGSGTSMVGLSVAVSGALIPIATNGFGNPTGQAAALDFAVPILPSSDGKDPGNTLVWMGEGIAGSGIGGLELAGLTYGVSGVTAAQAGTAIDSGIAGINSGGDVELIRTRAFRTHLQYVLPGARWALSGGYAQAEGRNLDRFAASASIAPKIQFGYMSAIYTPLPWLRLAAEINQTQDTYNDAANRYAINNRYQFSSFFVF